MYPALTAEQGIATGPMPHELLIAPSGHLALVEPSADGEGAELPGGVVAAFAESPARRLLHLATGGLEARLPAPLEYARSFACAYLARLCQTQGHEATRELPPTPPPSAEELGGW